MKTPPIVSPEEWEAARLELVAKEKALTRARDAMAAERRRMPWLAVENGTSGMRGQGRRDGCSAASIVATVAGTDP